MSTVAIWIFPTLPETGVISEGSIDQCIILYKQNNATNIMVQAAPLQNYFPIIDKWI